MPYVKQQTHFKQTIQINNGEITAQEDLIFDCNFTGNNVNVGTNTIVVGLPCTMNANIQAGVVEIIGTLNGNIVASESIQIRDTAVVNGDIQAPLIRVEPLARFQGRITYT